MYSKKKLKLSISNINIIIYIQLSWSSEGLRYEENEEENEI